MTFKSLVEPYCNRFAAISLRERAMISFALLLLTAVLGYTFLVEPEQVRIKKLAAGMEQKRKEVKNLEAQWTALQTQLKQDPNALTNTELAHLRSELRLATEQLRQESAALVLPAEMNTVLESFLRPQHGVSLVSLRTLPPTPFLEEKGDQVKGEKPEQRGGQSDSGGAVQSLGTTQAVGKNQGFAIYRHGVELKLNGDYPALTAYLKQLEGQKRPVLWEEVQLKALEYPKAELTLRLYTLSVDPAWLSL